MTVVESSVDLEERITHLQQLRVLTEQVLTGRRLRERPEPAPPTYDREAWKRLEDAGLTRLTGREAVGGAGASWQEAGVLLSSIGRTAADVPVAEHDLLAGWLLDRARMSPVPGAVYSAAGVDALGNVPNVPWGRCVDRIALFGTHAGVRYIADVDAQAVRWNPAENYAGEHRDCGEVGAILSTGKALGAREGESLAMEFSRRGAISRGAMIAGAAERVLELVIDHAESREQFGRPISRFQAVQALIADIGAEAALIRAASDAEVRIADVAPLTSTVAGFAVAAATSCVGHASSVVVRNAHQVLGAMGYTQEHALPRFTNRILSWRSEFGSLRDWDREVLKYAGDENRSLWSYLVDGPGTKADDNTRTEKA
jgi:acyl-CoA dehydrogenase